MEGKPITSKSPRQISGVPRSDFADGASTSGSSGYKFDVSSQKRKQSDFVDGASTSGYKYDVFLSFRDPDTRYTGADVLYESLVKAGFSVFRDKEELPVGEKIGPELEHAIHDSRIYVPIFLEGYASSPWRLQELAHMVKRRKESAGHEIVPVFFGASLSDVRLKRCPYVDDLLGHERRYGEERVREWKEALREVADFKGWDARNLGLGKLVKDLVRELSIKLKKRQKVLPEHLVGIDGRVRHVMQLLDCGSPDVRFLVVHGMGGIGKTTLAMAVYNEISSLFDGCSFLSDIRETSLNGGIVSLQKQLLSDILKWSTDVNDGNDGTNLTREKFRNRRVLIVLDDMDELEQLKKLKGNNDWLGPGSTVIITTRNAGLLAFLPKEKLAYEMMEMDPWHALQLFSEHAFRETLPQDDLETLSNEIVATTGRIPLALEASGSFLRGKSPEVWAETLERLRKVPDRRVQETLRISYEALSREEKQIYLDIACFFNGEESTSAKYAWESRGYSPESRLATLREMSLLKIDRQNILRMHDLIGDFGREIVREENHLNPGSRSRLWKLDECLHVLREQADDQRENNVESLRLQLSEKSSNLRSLELEGCSSLTRFPDLSASSTLRRLTIQGCQSLVEIDRSIGNLESLTRLDVESVGIRELPNSIGELKNLESLFLSRCYELRKLPDSIGRLESLLELDLSHTKIAELPDSIGNMRKLKAMRIGQSEIRRILGSIGMVERLEEFHAENCANLEGDRYSQ
ncbi:disease resistance protein RPV1-like [Eucalyptus grandis]|uniref:disease resistance protein RPV1-like n=1 Tax=Eucalyptus grandis TaxID=71139 RepID=UPI00192EA26A|nr:disease resistance protein RPV1-like [Eucalyptus grandis]